MLEAAFQATADTEASVATASVDIAVAFSEMGVDSEAAQATSRIPAGGAIDSRNTMSMKKGMRVRHAGVAQVHLVQPGERSNQPPRKSLSPTSLGTMNLPPSVPRLLTSSPQPVEVWISLTTSRQTTTTLTTSSPQLPHLPLHHKPRQANSPSPLQHPQPAQPLIPSSQPPNPCRQPRHPT